jgi:hypothetical protein
VYEYLEELDQMNWSARGNVLNQYLRNTSIGTTVNVSKIKYILRYIPAGIIPSLMLGFCGLNAVEDDA